MCDTYCGVSNVPTNTLFYLVQECFVFSSPLHDLKLKLHLQFISSWLFICPVWHYKCENVFLSFPPPHPPIPFLPTCTHQEEEVVKDEVLGDPEYLEKLKAGFIEDMNLMLALSIHGPM